MANLMSKLNKTQSDNLICGFNQSLTVLHRAGFYKVDKTHIRFIILKQYWTELWRVSYGTHNG